MNDTQCVKCLIFFNGALPVAMMGWDGYRHQMGANPLEFVTHTTGTMTLIFLALSLAVSPLQKIFQLSGLIKYRRMLGLYAFFYALVHFFSYVWFDKAFHITKILSDILNRNFIAIGMLSFFLLVPLAITSTDKIGRAHV